MKPVLALIFATVTLASPAAALDASTGAGIAQICGQETNMPAEICDCVGKKAEEQFSPDGMMYLAAVMSGQKEMANSLKKNISTDEVIGAAMFMVSAPGQCAG